MSQRVGGAKEGDEPPGHSQGKHLDGQDYPRQAVDNFYKDAYGRGGMNDRQRKAIADVAVTITANVSVIGAGLALYEKKWECLIVAFISLFWALIIAWRSNK